MVKKLKLSAVNTQPTPTIHCIQYDTDRQIELCFDDIELAGLQEARIYGKKPDGTEFYNDCTIEDGKLIAPLTSQALAVKGIVPCQIQLVFGGTLTTYTFNVVVDDSLVSESAIESSNEYTALENALAEVEEVIGEIGDGIVKSVNGLKNDVYFVDGNNTYVMTNIPDNEISYDIIVDDALSDTSVQPVQNKVIKSAIDGKLDLSGGIMQGKIIMDGHDITNVNELALEGSGGKIKNLADPTNATDGANKNYVDTQEALNEKLANKVTAFTGNETDTQYPSAKLVFDTLNGKLDKTGGIMTGNLELSSAMLRFSGTTPNPAVIANGRRIAQVGDPTIVTDAVNKRYVDNAIAAALIVDTEEVIP